MTKELRFDKKTIADRRANSLIMKKMENINLCPSGPPRIAPTSRAPRRPPLPPLVSYATEGSKGQVPFYSFSSAGNMSSTQGGTRGKVPHLPSF